MEFRQLKYFLAVAETLNFSRASEALYLSQSALSRQIAELEEELGVTLFIRDKRTVAITPAGEALRAEAQKLLRATQSWGEMLRNAEGADGTGRSMFVGVDSKAMADEDFRKVLTESVHSLRQSHPGIQTRSRQLDFQILLEGVLSGELDVAFILDAQNHFDERFETKLLWEEEMVLCIRDDKTHTPNEIKRMIRQRGLLLLERENRGLSQIMRILDDLKVEAEIRFCENRNTMTLGMESGESIVILPLTVVKKLNNPEIQIFKLNSGNTKMYLHAVWLKTGSNPYLPDMLKTVEDYAKTLRQEV